MGRGQCYVSPVFAAIALACAASLLPSCCHASGSASGARWQRTSTPNERGMEQVVRASELESHAVFYRREPLPEFPAFRRVRDDAMLRSVTQRLSVMPELNDPASSGRSAVFTHVSAVDVATPNGDGAPVQRLNFQFLVALSDGVRDVAATACIRHGLEQLGVDCKAVARSIDRELSARCEVQWETSWSVSVTVEPETQALSIESEPTTVVEVQPAMVEDGDTQRRWSLLVHVTRDANVETLVRLAASVVEELGSAVSDAQRSAVHALLAERRHALAERQREMDSLSLPLSGTVVSVDSAAVAPGGDSELPAVAAVIRFSTLERRFLPTVVSQARLVARHVVVVAGDHFHDGEPEDHHGLIRAMLDSSGADFLVLPINATMSRRITSDHVADDSWWWGGWANLQGVRHLRALKRRGLIEFSHILLLDADEVVDAPRMRAALRGALKHPSLPPVLVFPVYYYWRSVKFRALRPEAADEVGPSLVNDNWLCEASLLSSRDRYLYYDAAATDGALVTLLGHDSAPLVHHFSWVRSREEMLRKVASWGHRRDRSDWADLVNQEFEREFRAGDRDFVKGYMYEQLLEGPFDFSEGSEGQES